MTKKNSVSVSVKNFHNGAKEMYSGNTKPMIYLRMVILKKEFSPSCQMQQSRNVRVWTPALRQVLKLLECICQADQ